MTQDGAEDLRSLGRALRGAERPVRSATLKALKSAATGDIQSAVRREASATLPGAGGLGRRVAQTRVTAKARLSGRQAGVRLVGRGRLKKIEALDEGRLRHPLFGDRRHWYGQSVRPGWWSRPIGKRAPQLRDDLAAAIGDELKSLVRE